MSKKLKSFAWFVCFVFIFSSLVTLPSLKSNSVKAASSSQQVKVLTFFYGDSNADPHPDLFSTPIGKEITKLTGVKLKIEYLAGQDEATKIGLMLASGDLPDLIHGHQEHGKLIEAGVLVPLDNYIQKYGKYCKQIYSAKDLKRLRQKGA